MMGVANAVARAALAWTLIVSSLAKLREPTVFRANLRAILPPRARPHAGKLALALLFAELLVGCLVLVPRNGRLTAAVAIGGVAAIATVAAVGRRDSKSCGCLGDHTEEDAAAVRSLLVALTTFVAACEIAGAGADPTAAAGAVVVVSVGAITSLIRAHRVLRLRLRWLAAT